TQKVIISDVAIASDRLLFRNTGMLMEGYNPADGTRNELASFSTPLYINSMSSLLQNTIINNSNSGKVGIGTEDPEGKLDVNGSTYLRDDIFATALDSASLDTLNLPYILVMNPQTGKLEKGSAKLLQGLINVEAASGGPTDCFVLPDGSIGTPNLYWESNPGKVFVRQTTCIPDPMVGIGIKPVNAKLHIRTNPAMPNTKAIVVQNHLGYKTFQVNANGLVYAHEVKVNLDVAWPDYVFEPTYKLRPLSEVKQFIIENKHLPNVPSAKEIEENGLNLGEGNKILLEKVEEMTLYMIQMEENLKKQEELLKAQAELLKAQQEQILLLQTQNK
ncbi:hypothetical protein, partial [Flavobacterium sp.]|uniref:hypothetical protein n=1 Tax=Flavobacterium sp. TaxID=239 RepID=UPI00286E2E4C